MLKLELSTLALDGRNLKSSFVDIMDRAKTMSVVYRINFALVSCR